MHITKPGTQVSYQYRKHQLLGGELVTGTGEVLHRVVIGTDDGYAIKPNDGGDVVHVRHAGVRELPQVTALAD